MKKILIILTVSITVLTCFGSFNNFHEEIYLPDHSFFENSYREPLHDKNLDRNFYEDKAVSSEECQYFIEDDTTFVSGGTLYGDINWTKEESPYVVTGSIVIDTFSSLIIEAGTEVLFVWGVPGRSIYVYGSIVFDGSITDSITFGKEHGYYGTWSGIHLKETAHSCIIKYTNFDKAIWAAIHNFYGDIDIHDCTFNFTNGRADHGLISAGGNLSVRNCIFAPLRSDRYGEITEGILCGDETSLNINNCVFFCETAILMSGPDYHAIIDSCLFFKGGIFVTDPGHISISRTLFALIYSSFSASEAQKHISMKNCTIYKCSSHPFLKADSIIVFNCISSSCTDNSGFRIWGNVYDLDSFNVSHNNVWNNFLGDWYFYEENPGCGINVTTNINGDSCDAFFNISENPHFVDELAWDFNLRRDSPLIDAGDPSIRDPDGTISDIGAFYYDQRDSLLHETGFLNAFNLSLYPNPFNSELTITFDLPENFADDSNKSNIEIYTITGDLINRLPVEQNSGRFYSQWNGTDYRGKSMPSGVYMVSLNACGMRYLKKVSLLR